MAELPFAEEPEALLPEVPQPPRGTGLRRVVVGVIAMGLCVGLAALLLFGTRTAHRMGRRVQAPKPVEAAPRPPTTGDPLRGLHTDYETLLAKTPPAAPAPPPSPPSIPPGLPASAPRPPAQAPAKKAEGMLVLEGKHQAASVHRAVPAYTQEKLPADGREPEKDPVPGPVERNRQFLQHATALQETTVRDRLQTPESPDMILAGDFLPAVLVQGIQSDLPGSLVARVSRDVRDSVTGRTVLIPQGTHIIGAYNNDIAHGQDRVLVVWHRLRLPNGQSIQLQGMPGIDLRGYAGLKDTVDHHLWPLFRAVLLSSVLSVGSRVPAGSPQQYQQTLAQEFAQDFASGANQAGQQIVRRELSRPPTVTIRPGMAFNVFVLKDLVLQPYTAAVTVRK